MICYRPEFKIDVVCEEKPTDNLLDGNLYVVSEQVDKSFVDKLADRIRCQKEATDEDGLIYSYDIHLISGVAEKISSRILLDAVRNGANVILPICTPNVCEKRYIVAELKMQFIDILIPFMMMKAENHTKESIKESLLNFAINEPEMCEDFLADNLNKEDEYDKKSYGFFARMISGFMPGIMGAAISPLASFSIPNNLTYKESHDIISRFVKNWNTVIRLEDKELTPKQMSMLKKAESECKYVFEQFDVGVYYKFTKLLSKKKDVLWAYDRTINRDEIARNSNIKVLVQSPISEIEDKLDPKTKNKKKTNGKYRVYLSNEEKIVQVKFGRSASCVIYIMYLLDRKKRGDDIDTLDIINNKQLFTSIYTQIYNKYGVEDICKTIWGTKKNDKSRLSDYYVNIRESLDEAVSEFKESSLPFYIPNKYSHITVLAENILISDDIVVGDFIRY